MNLFRITMCAVVRQGLTSGCLVLLARDVSSSSVAHSRLIGSAWISVLETDGILAVLVHLVHSKVTNVSDSAKGHARLRRSTVRSHLESDNAGSLFRKLLHPDVADVPDSAKGHT